MPSLPFRIDMAMVLAPTRTRRILVGVAIFVFLVLYFRSLSFKAEPLESTVSINMGKFPPCLDGYKLDLERRMSEMDVIVNLGEGAPDKLFMVANGHVATTPLNGAHSVLLDNGQPLDLGHNINLKFYIRGSPFKLAMTVLDLRNGQVDLHYVSEGCIAVKESIYASLTSTSTISHDVYISNPTRSKQTVTIKAGTDTHLDNVSDFKVGDKTGVVYSDSVKSSNGVSYVVSAASVLTHKTIAVGAGGVQNAKLFVSLSSIKLREVGETSEKRTKVSNFVKEQISGLDQDEVSKKHVEEWDSLRTSGLRLQPLQDHLMAKPLEINLTMYYLLTMYRDSEPEGPISLTDCFKGSPSSHSPVLWTQVKSLDAAYSRLVSWKAMLAGGGCSELTAGSRGLFYQSLLRSFTGVIETVHGMELALNPHSMEGFITLTGILFNDILINMEVAVNTPTHKGYVKVSKDKEYNDKVLYACDQICASEVTLLPANGGSVVFDIHPTNPSTPLLYVASSKEQLITLRQMIEDHHGMDLHSLEEHPISALFIIVISIVIVVFHALLFHMIYKEFCSGDRGFNKSTR